MRVSRQRGPGMGCSRSSPGMLQQPWGSSTEASPSPWQTLHTHHLTPIIPPQQGPVQAPQPPVGLGQGAAGRDMATGGLAPACSEGSGRLPLHPDTSTLPRDSAGRRCTRAGGAGGCLEDQEKMLAVLWLALPAGREGSLDGAESLRVCHPSSSTRPRQPSPAGIPARTQASYKAAQGRAALRGAKALAQLLALCDS